MTKKRTVSKTYRKSRKGDVMRSAINGSVFGVTKPGKIVLFMTTGTLIKED